MNNVTPIATVVIVLVVVIAGAVVTIVNPSTLSFHNYVQDVAIGGGLLGIGRGFDSGSRP